MFDFLSLWALSSITSIESALYAVSSEKQDSQREGATKIQCASVLASVDDAARYGLPVSKRGNVAFVKLKGVMLRSYPYSSDYVASSYHVQKAIEAAHADENIDHVVVLADTPGGSVGGMHELGDAIKACAKDKTVIFQVQGTLASAGYYIGAGATAIYSSHKMNDIGSIGVRTAMVDSSKYYADQGIRVIKIDTGEHKSTGAEGVPISDEQVAEVQRMVDEIYADFIRIIVGGRSMSEKDVRALADGRTWFSQDAVDNGLIDGVQDLNTTLAGLAPTKSKGQGITTASAEAQLSQFG